MVHDRIHARRPHDAERYDPGIVRGIEERDGHCVVTVVPASKGSNDGPEPSGPDEGAEPVELVVTRAVRDLFVDRLDLDPGESPVGARVWFREHGGPNN